ncbi:MAG TPA: hypothetical protein VG986_17765 [Pseudolabrys sp.]|nr:hypothetical protein [Pseudolabrys sp.]
MSLDYPFTIKAAVDRDYLDYVAACIERHAGEFMPNSFDPERRKWWRFGEDPVLDAKKHDLIARFGLPDWVPEPDFGDYIGWIAEGGSIHTHRDNAPRDKMHVRINVLVRKPDAGCVPVLDEQPIDIDLGDAWICLASQCWHAATPVVGKAPRNVVSYGMRIDRVTGLPLYAKYLGWRSAVARAAPPTQTPPSEAATVQ